LKDLAQSSSVELVMAVCTAAEVLASRTAAAPVPTTATGIHMLAAAAVICSTGQQVAAASSETELDIGQREQVMVDLSVSAGVYVWSHKMLLVARLQ